MTDFVVLTATELKHMKSLVQRILLLAIICTIALVGCGKHEEHRGETLATESKHDEHDGEEHSTAEGKHDESEEKGEHADDHDEDHADDHDGSGDPHDLTYTKLADAEIGSSTFAVAIANGGQAVKVSTTPPIEAIVRGLIVNSKGEESIKTKAAYCGGHKAWTIVFEECPEIDAGSTLTLEVEAKGQTAQATLKLK